MEYPPIPAGLYYGKSEIHGIGIFTSAALKAGTVLGKFEGVEMTRQDFKKKYNKDFQYCCVSPFGFHTVVVAKEKRNWITYMNESSEPNCKIQRRHCKTVCEIPANTELTLYYGKFYPRDYLLKP